MNKQRNRVMVLSLASCALLLYLLASPTTPSAVTLLSLLSSQAIAADDDDDDYDDDVLDDSMEDELDDEDGFIEPENDDTEQPRHIDDNHQEHHSENDMEGGPAEPDDLDWELDSQGYIIKVAEILAINADDTSLELIEALGFTVLRKRNLDALDISITIIETPAALSVHDAIHRLRQSDPNAFGKGNTQYIPTQILPM